MAADPTCPATIEPRTSASAPIRAPDSNTEPITVAPAVTVVVLRDDRLDQNCVGRDDGAGSRAVAGGPADAPDEIEVGLQELLGPPCVEPIIRASATPASSPPTTNRRTRPCSMEIRRSGGIISSTAGLEHIRSGIDEVRIGLAGLRLLEETTHEASLVHPTTPNAEGSSTGVRWMVPAEPNRRCSLIKKPMSRSVTTSPSTAKEPFVDSGRPRLRMRSHPPCRAVRARRRSARGTSP